MFTNAALTRRDKRTISRFARSCRSLCVFAAFAFLAGCGDGSSNGAGSPILDLPFPPVPACLESFVKRGELSASPRSDRMIETLAQRLSPGLTADQAVYERLMRDRASIANGWPEIVRAFRHTRAYREEILLGTPVATAEAMLAGTYSDWDCLNNGLSAAVDRRFSDGVVVRFSGPLLTLERVSELYAALPNVRYAEPNYIVSLVTVTWSDTGVTPVGDVWHYVIWQPGSCVDCAPEGYFYFTTFVGGGVTIVDSWRQGDARPEPSWVETYWRRAQSRQPLAP